MATKGTGVSAKQLVREIEGDLPQLLKGKPRGISMNELHTYYGEEQGKVRVHVANNHTHYITSGDTPPLSVLDQLSNLQQDTVRYLYDLVKGSNIRKVRTNYTQLSRILACSATGIRNCIDRLQTLGFVRILHPSKHGKQDELLLELLPPLFESIQPPQPPSDPKTPS
jgi:hypothetical protein